jgi:hypothetical protein
MTINTVKVNITVEPETQGKWYGKEKIDKKSGEKTVIFFQRDGKRNIFQKLMDFKKGVRFGTELASQYSKELGLPTKALSNPKTKSEKPAISNDELNKMFLAAHDKIKNNGFFESSDPLVSNNKVSVSINKERINNAEDYKNSTFGYFMGALNHTDFKYNDFKEHISLALDVRADPNFKADNKKINETIESLQKLKTNELTGHANPKLTNYDSRKSQFDKKIDSLIAVLEEKLSSIEKTAPT